MKIEVSGPVEECIKSLREWLHEQKEHFSLRLIAHADSALENLVTIYSTKVDSVLVSLIIIENDSITFNLTITPQ